MGVGWLTIEVFFFFLFCFLFIFFLALDDGWESVGRFRVATTKLLRPMISVK